MYQAYAGELLNQKESENDSSVTAPVQHPLDNATKRLVEALNRLENSLETLTPREEAGQAELFAHENNALRHERENLNSAISQLQFQYNDLHDVASTIYGKLDDSIRRLTQIIEN